MKSRFVRSFVCWLPKRFWSCFVLFVCIEWKKTKKLNETQKISSETLVGANTSFRFPECIFLSKKSNSFSRKWIDWLEKPFPCVEVVPKKNFFLTIFHKKCETLKFEMSVNSGKERCLDFHNGSAKSKTGDVTAGHIDIFSDCYSSRGSAADGLSGPEENGLENISFGLIVRAIPAVNHLLLCSYLFTADQPFRFNQVI